MTPLTFDEEQTLALAAWLAKEPEAAAAWVFGSRARGDAKPSSDVDVAVLLREPLPGDLLRLRLRFLADAADVLGIPAERLDLVLMNEASPLLVHAVLREGVLLFDAEPRQRVAFQEAALHRYVIAARLRDEAMRARAARFGVHLP